MPGPPASSLVCASALIPPRDGRGELVGTAGGPAAQADRGPGGLWAPHALVQKPFLLVSVESPFTYFPPSRLLTL